MKRPTVSVLMSTYNTPDEWLCESIESILGQTMGDFEFLIVDDCSTTQIEPIQKKFVDERIIWIRNEENLGLTKSLNKLLKMAQGKYIARMDADDIALPERFAVQVKYLEENPDVIVVGSYRRAFGNEEKDEIWNLPKTREEQQAQLFFFNCGVTHPTAMIRKEMLDQYGITYNETYRKAQDYGLWVQCTRYAPMAMIPKVLLKYRKSDKQISTAGKSDQRANSARVKTDQLQYLGIDASDEEKAMHVKFCNNECIESPDILREWIDCLIKSNKDTNYFDNTMFVRILTHRWYQYCRRWYVEEHRESYRVAYLKARTLRELGGEAVLRIKKAMAKVIRR